MAKTKAGQVAKHATPQNSDKSPPGLDFEVSWENFEKVRAHFKLTDAECQEVLVSHCGPNEKAEAYWKRYKKESVGASSSSTPAAELVPKAEPEPVEPPAKRLRPVEVPEPVPAETQLDTAMDLDGESMTSEGHGDDFSTDDENPVVRAVKGVAAAAPAAVTSTAAPAPREISAEEFRRDLHKEFDSAAAMPAMPPPPNKGVDKAPDRRNIVRLTLSRFNYTLGIHTNIPKLFGKTIRCPDQAPKAEAPKFDRCEPLAKMFWLCFFSL